MKGIFVSIIALFPGRLIESIIRVFVFARTKQLNPGEALSFLFRLDAFLYSFQAKKAIEYGGGIHTKHWHTHYHDFFVNRIAKGERVLDIGCGNGALDYDVADKAEAYVLGVDKSEANIRQAKERFNHKRVRYITGDVLRNIPEDDFDVVILSNVLEHLSERYLFLRKVQKHAKPNDF